MDLIESENGIPERRSLSLLIYDSQFKFKGWSHLLSSGQTITQTAMTHFTSQTNKLLRLFGEHRNQSMTHALLLSHLSFLFCFPLFLSLQISWQQVKGVSQHKAFHKAQDLKLSEDATRIQQIHSNSPVDPGTVLDSQFLSQSPFSSIVASIFY